MDVDEDMCEYPPWGGKIPAATRALMNMSSNVPMNVQPHTSWNQAQQLHHQKSQHQQLQYQPPQHQEPQHQHPQYQQFQHQQPQYQHLQHQQLCYQQPSYQQPSYQQLAYHHQHQQQQHQHHHHHHQQQQQQHSSHHHQQEQRPHQLQVPQQPRRLPAHNDRLYTDRVNCGSQEQGYGSQRGFSLDQDPPPAFISGPSRSPSTSGRGLNNERQSRPDTPSFGPCQSTTAPWSSMNLRVTHSRHEDQALSPGNSLAGTPAHEEHCQTGPPRSTPSLATNEDSYSTSDSSYDQTMGESILTVTKPIGMGEDMDGPWPGQPTMSPDDEFSDRFFRDDALQALESTSQFGIIDDDQASAEQPSGEYLDPNHQIERRQEESYQSSTGALPPTDPTEPTVLFCSFPGCDAQFSGDYRKGNQARHMRTQHGDGGSAKHFLCEEEGCPKVFRRKDARLKHYRKHHPERVPGDAVRRKIVSQE